MPTATGTFEITGMGEDVYHEGSGQPRLARANGTQRFAGDIVGEGQVEWLACYLASGSARLLGLQRIEGTIGGRTGSLVIEALADHDGQASTGQWRVVDGSGAGELAAIRGTGGFEASGPTAAYHLEYDLD